MYLNKLKEENSKLALQFEANSKDKEELRDKVSSSNIL